MSSEYLRSNPLAEHNSGIALSSKETPPPQAGGTGNMYQGQGGRAFVQGGGGMSQYHSFADDGQDKSYAHGSYAPVTVGCNSVTRGGRRRRGSGSKRKLRRSCKTMRKGSRTCRIKNCKCCCYTCHIKKCKCTCHSRSRSRSRSRSHSRSNSRKYKQQGGSGFANAAYSIGGADTGVGRDTSALANPAPYTAYNSCHPVA